MKKIKYILTVFLVLFVLALITIQTYNTMEPKAYDFMTRNVLNYKLPFDSNKNINGSDDIVLIVIDHRSLEKYRWPWRRDLNCKLYEYLREYSTPKAVAIDAILTALDTNAPEADKKFFESLSKFNNMVYGFMFNVRPYENAADGENYDKKFVEKYGLKNIQSDIKLPQVFPAILTSPDELLNSVKHIGSITLISGFLNGKQLDEKYRTVSYLNSYRGAYLPSIALSTFMVVNNYPPMKIDKDYITFPEQGYKIKHKISSNWFLSLVPIRYYSLDNDRYSHKHYSAVDIMDSYDAIKQGKKPKISPEVFNNKIVLIGVNDPLSDGLNDNKGTPMSPYHPAMDIQATCIDNILHNDFLVVLPDWVNLLIALLGMYFSYYAIKNQHLIKALSTSLLVLFLILAIAAACFYFGIVVTVITPIIMCIYVVLISYINRYLIEERKKEKVTSALGKYMSEDVMKDVMKNIDNLGLGGKKAVVTVLFSDIRGFTSMSEKMSAQEVSQLLNEYFSAMEPIVSKYNGIINKFIGDAVMAVFGEPIQDANHPLNAVRCGYEMLLEVEELNKKWEQEGKPVIRIGVGINTGDVFIGNIGSENRMEYTVIGDTVNLASRLESYNKTYGTQILISSSTYEFSKDFINVNQISDVEIRGKAEKMNIYEVKEVK